MSDISRTIEKHYMASGKFQFHRYSQYKMGTVFEAICKEAVTIAKDIGAKLILCVTQTGSTAQIISKYYFPYPIVAITNDKDIYYQLAITWGVVGYWVPKQINATNILEVIHDTIKRISDLKKGDYVVWTAGIPQFSKFSTNMIKVEVV